MSPNPTAVEIGKEFEAARRKAGYDTILNFTESKSFRSHMKDGKGKQLLGYEGYRKIALGERIPRLETIEALGTTLGLSKRKIKELQRKAVEENAKRGVRRAGKADVSFNIEGKPVRISTLPPRSSTEAMARELVDDLAKIVEKYGVLEEDVAHFRRHARSAVLNRLP